MNSKKAEKLFELMRKHGVEHFKTLELEIRMGMGVEASYKAPEEPVMESRKTPPPPAAVPPVEQSIPHHVNEVANLLKLNDNDLVDKLFPDYTQPPQGGS